MRRMIGFDCKGARLAGTLDEGDTTTGLLIISGGNEIRSGAYAGQAAIAQHFAAKGHPVFRYDRRGIGDSEGHNNGFETSADDIAAAVATFRAEAPHMQRLVAFGNCDAATALALFHGGLPIDALLLANPWVIETRGGEPDAPTPPTAAAIRARYLARIKNPRSLLDLFTGKIDLRKLASGLARAAVTDAPTQLGGRLAKALEPTTLPVMILIAARDTTAMAFIGAWESAIFANVRKLPNLRLSKVDSASHSFANDASKAWLFAQISDALA
jgi:exosortase A-associated hydrolase 1